MPLQALIGMGSMHQVDLVGLQHKLFLNGNLTKGNVLKSWKLKCNLNQLFKDFQSMSHVTFQVEHVGNLNRLFNYLQKI